MRWTSDFLTVTKDPVWPWSAAGWGLPALAIAAVVLVVLTVWTYRGAPGARGRRVAALVGLRLLALLLVLLMLLRPALAFREDLRLPSTLIVAIDSSQSMTIQDEIDGRSRWAYVQELLGRCESLFKQLEDDHNISVVRYQFGPDVAAYEPDAKPEGKRTDFGQMLHSLYENHGRDSNLRDLIIISDGADNGTRYPALAEAAKWRGLQCPISPFGVGKETTGDRQRDLAVVSIATEPTPVAVKGKLTVKAVIDAPGFEGVAPMVRLFLDDKEVLSQKAELRKTLGNEVRLTTDAPATPGEIKVTLKVEPQTGEVTTANNEISTFVTVTKEGVSVLLVDAPRYPEPQRIADALGTDPRIRLYTAWLRTDEPSPQQADLFQFDKQHYDVIIVGDLTAARLSGGNPAVLAKIEDLVSRERTGLLLMGGYSTFGNSDWRNTPLERLSPVNIDVSGQSDDLWQMEPTPAGLSHFVMRLADKPADNKLLWDKLPKLNGMTKLGPKKTGAEILAVRKVTQEPVLVGQVYGRGRTLAFAGDTTWRWERLGQPKSMQGVELHARFWKQAVLWLAWQDEAEGNVWVKPDARRLPAGSKLGFSVGVHGKGGAAAAEPRFEVSVVDPKGNETPVPTAREAEDERGTFWKTDLPGEYRLKVRGSGKDADGSPVDGTATARFLIYQDDAEMLRRAADHKFLEKLAAAGGDRFYKAEDLPRFLKALESRPLPHAKPKTELYPDWRKTSLSGFRVGIFLAFVALLSLEWLLRRRWNMV